MATPITLDEIHLTFVTTAGRSERTYAPALAVLHARSFLRRVRRAIRAVLDAHPELTPVRLRVTR